MAEGCAFCKVVSGQGDYVVFEDETTMAFLDYRPVFHGHCLVVPKAHYGTLADLPADLIAPFFSSVQLVAGAVEQAMHAQGTFVAMNNRVSQSVPHVHVHVVPRSKGDGLKGFFWPRHPYPSPGAMRQTADVVAQAIASRLPR